jgi:hypothetical protein
VRPLRRVDCDHALGQHHLLVEPVVLSAVPLLLEVGQALSREPAVYVDVLAREPLGVDAGQISELTKVLHRRVEPRAGAGSLVARARVHAGQSAAGQRAAALGIGGGALAPPCVEDLLDRVDLNRRHLRLAPGLARRAEPLSLRYGKQPRLEAVQVPRLPAALAVAQQHLVSRVPVTNSARRHK